MGAVFIGRSLGTLLYHCSHQCGGGAAAVGGGVWGGAEPCLPPCPQILQSQPAFPKQMKACLVSVVPPSSRRNPTFPLFSSVQNVEQRREKKKSCVKIKHGWCEEMKDKRWNIWQADAGRLR